VRLFFGDGVPPGTVYLDIAGLEAFHAEAKAAGVPFTASPALVHRDTEGRFGPAGESEWMAFLKDPGGNTIGLVERLAPEEH
ncbi:MAG: glyoxalase, partial [Mesorhizobium sp.]